MRLIFYYKVFEKVFNIYHYRIKKNRNVLKEILIKNNQTRWLDLGSNLKYSKDFYFADILDVSDIPEEMRSKYFKVDVCKPLSNDNLERLGKFDLIRMQHVFEHFTMEDGLIALENSYKMLNSKGYLLISIPDLNIFVKRYRHKNLHSNWSFAEWARTRIPEDAPQCFYFSVFSHSVLYQPHLWCYDKEGLIYQLNKSGKFINIKRIRLFDNLCNIPFTHNRPLEDLCLLSQKI
jgi:hypothetical protein